MKREAALPYIGVVGMSHKTSPVEMRECFAVPDQALPVFFDKTCAGGAEEIVYLSTCNRIEVYFTTHDLERTIDGILGILGGMASMPRQNFETQLYKKYNRDAVLHLFGVASSLDSMVVGENEIFFQVKNCYRKAVHAGRTGPVLNRLFHQAFKTAKRVRTETEITKNPLSIAYIATELARKIFEDLSSKRALLVGAGEMGELILKYFTKHGIGDITIANRSLHNAQRIADEINRQAHIAPLEDMAEQVAGVDIVIASASAPGHIITTEMVRTGTRRRGGRPLFLIDIAVPRNIDPDAGRLDGVFLYNIDDLKTIAGENLKNRLQEVELARRFVEADADEFNEWYEGLVVVPFITRIQDAFDGIRQSELERYRRRKLKNLSEEEFRAVEELTVQIMTKTLHNPISYLKQFQGGKGHRQGDSKAQAAKIIEELFKK